MLFFSHKAFEELERALGVAHKAEEARKQLQVQMEEQVKNIEMEGEEERKKLQQELTRVKQEVVIIMKVREWHILSEEVVNTFKLLSLSKCFTFSSV